MISSALALLGLAGCDARGVSLGTEELCVADPRLAAPELRSAEESVTTCARLGSDTLTNAGFEAPAVGTCQNGFFCQFPAADVPAWQTTSTAQIIEVWTDGHRDVPSHEGSQYVELDAASQDIVWQDVALPPGQLMYWSLAHRGRGGIDSIELRLGAPEAPASQGVLTSAEDAWYGYSGLYRVGEAETMTRFALVSRTGIDEGNFVDATFFAPVDERSEP